jgi:hypothetical protein
VFGREYHQKQHNFDISPVRDAGDKILSNICGRRYSSVVGLSQRRRSHLSPSPPLGQKKDNGSCHRPEINIGNSLDEDSSNWVYFTADANATLICFVLQSG